MVSQPSGHSDPMKRSFEAFIRPLGNSSNPGKDAESIQSTKILGIWVGALVLWLWEETYVQYVVNLNPSTVFCCCKFVYSFDEEDVNETASLFNNLAFVADDVHAQFLPVVCHIN